MSDIRSTALELRRHTSMTGARFDEVLAEYEAQVRADERERESITKEKTVIGRNDVFYATHYGPGSGWEIHRLNVCISVPAKGGSPSESLNLIREILDNADFDIRVTELARAEPTDSSDRR